MAVGQGMSEYGDRRCTYARDQKAQRGDGSPVAVDITVLETEEMHVAGRYAQCAGTEFQVIGMGRHEENAGHRFAGTGYRL